ncbi:MAG TPA: hypothetical protein VFI87_17510, partial [Hyphomicrobiaceae bacterium]|nr:hypothetical protein [Hyphomicrobiaceae bacterium]
QTAPPFGAIIGNARCPSLKLKVTISGLLSGLQWLIAAIGVILGRVLTARSPCREDLAGILAREEISDPG